MNVQMHQEAAEQSRRRRIIRVFEEAKAIDPVSAQTLAALKLKRSSTFEGMLKSSVIVATDGERWYLSRPALRREQQRNRRRLLLALILILVVGVVGAAWMLR